MQRRWLGRARRPTHTPILQQRFLTARKFESTTFRIGDDAALPDIEVRAMSHDRGGRAAPER
jgi:hypothetical protein